MDSATDFLVEKALKEDSLNLMTAAQAMGLDERVEGLRQHNKGGFCSRIVVKDCLNLTPIKDLLLKRRMVAFLLHEMTGNHLNFSSYYTYRVLPAGKLIPLYGAESYAEAVEKTESGAYLAQVKNVNPVRAFCSYFSRYCRYCDTENHPFERDVWYTEDFSPAAERTNLVASHKTIHFERIQNMENKRLVKLYMEYQLRETGKTIGGLCAEANTLGRVLNYNPKPYTAWSSEDGDRYAQWLRTRYSKQSTVITTALYMEQFTSFLIKRGLLEDSPIKQYHSLACIGHAYEYKTTAPDTTVVDQIFAALGDVRDEDLVIYFLMIYAVGMRSSEAAALERGCLEKTEAGTFVSYYAIKMKKYVSNVIPPALYERVQSYSGTLPKDTKWLFPSRSDRSRPMQRSSLSVRLKKELKRLNIKNPDGSEYVFHAHSFRHLMGVKMREQKIPFAFIQQQLHHESPEMTLAYLEYVDKQKIRKMNEFIDVHGKAAMPAPGIRIDDDVTYAEFIRDHLNEQLLPNGHCARPVKLGKCPHANTCLSCSSFRTGAKDLAVHQAHLKRVKEAIAVAEENNWLPQLETQKELKKTLETIISSLGGDTDGRKQWHSDAQRRTAGFPL